MPRIDPFQLLKILRVLLAPNGGIKSREEVQRIASLMFKFSKKLVSKCIYVSILKASEPDLLIMWMSAGGWDLIYNWLSDAVLAENWPLVSELVDLLLICPVDIERLKSNRCPKLIKTLSKNQNATESVQLAAAQIVKKWLDVVNDVLIKQKTEDEDQDTEVDNKQLLPVYRIIKQDGKEVLTKVPPKEELKHENDFDSAINEEVAESEISKKKLEVEKPVKQSGLKTKKVMNDLVPRKVTKVENFSDASSDSSSSGSERGDNAGLNNCPFVPSNKSDPTKDRRKDKMRQIRKDPDALDEDFVLEEYEKQSSPIRSRKKKIESRDNKLKLKKKTVKTEEKHEPIAVVTQEKANNPDISKLGRIPKKGEQKALKKDYSDKKQKSESTDKNHTTEKKTDRSSSKSKDSDKDFSKLKDRNKSPEKDAKLASSGKTDSVVKKLSEIRKPLPEIKRDSRKYNISVEARKVAPGEARPKTVKTFNSKFRSTGLEEELPPPPAIKSSKKVLVPPLSLLEKKPIKRVSPTKEVQPPEKKPKAESSTPSAATVPPPKQSPASKAKFLQESGSFMDALNASMSSSKDSKKKKPRRLSSSKDSDKKESSQTTPPTSPNHDDKSPPLAKPNFRFYQDTLDHSEDIKSESTEEKKKLKENPIEPGEEGDSNEQKHVPSPETPEQKAVRQENIRNEENRQNCDGLKGVLVFAKLRKGPKKKVQWKTNLVAIRHFELEENERVNVTKTFIDMKQMERIHERENFQIARKLGSVDVMEEKTRWRVLIPIDLPALPVIPGKNSNEKEIQYAREKTAVQAVYPNRRLIPDSPAEPDLEIHATTDPTIIPLDDLSGNEDSVNDFTNDPWPEPKIDMLPVPCEQPVVPSMGPNAPEFAPEFPPDMVPPGNFMGPAGGPMPVGPPGFPGPGMNQGGPGPMGPMGPGPNMGFPGPYPGPGVPFGPPQPGPPNMGMMPPNEWMGPGPDMKGPGGPGPDMFGPGPGMGPPPGMMPPDMAGPYGMGGPIVPGLLGHGPMPPGGPPFNMNQVPNQGPPNMFNGPAPPGPGPFPIGNNNVGNNGGNNNFGGNSNMNNQNWNRGGDDRNERGGDVGGGGRGGGGGKGGGGGPWRNKRDRGDRRGGRGGNWGGSKNILCNNFARWGSCRTVNCNFRHHN